jgi:hypothetical protein
MKRQNLKFSGIALVVLLLAGACAPAPTPAPTPTPVPPTPTPGPVNRVMAFQEAFNKGAVDETAAMFADDKVGVVLVSLGLEYHPTGVRNNLEYAAGTGLKLEFSDCKPEGDAVNCTLLLRDDACLKSSGLDPAQGTARIKFLADKINLLTTTLASEDDAEYGKCIECQYSIWGMSNRPAVVEKLNKSPGADITARQQGELLAQLCKDWAAAKK